MKDLQRLEDHVSGLVSHLRMQFEFDSTDCNDLLLDDVEKVGRRESLNDRVKLTTEQNRHSVNFAIQDSNPVNTADKLGRIEVEYSNSVCGIYRPTEDVAPPGFAASKISASKPGKSFVTSINDLKIEQMEAYLQIRGC